MELNGQKATAEDVVPLALYNYGNFTTMLVDNLQVRGLSLHLERLDRDARTLFGVGIEPEKVRRLVRQTLVDVTGPTAVRITVFCKEFDMAHPAKSCKPDILVTPRPAPSLPLPPISLEPMFYQRELPETKTTIIGGAMHRRRLAQTDGFDDALFISQSAQIMEGPTWNIGFTRRNQVILPDALTLPGVSIALLEKALGSQAQTHSVSLQDMSSMDAAFIINATNGIRKVQAIGDHTFATQDKLDELRKVYEGIAYEPL